MKHLSSLIITIFFFVDSVYAWQTLKPIEFGVISKEEFEMSHCPIDSTASAVILYDKGEATFDPLINGLSLKRHVRMKVFKKDAYDAANISIRVWKTQTSKKVKGNTYNINNGIVEESKLEPQNIMREDMNDFFDILHIAMPSVREGSIFEIIFELDGVGIPIWRFQSSYPTLWSEYYAKISNQVNFRKLITGYITPDVYEESYGYLGKNTCKIVHAVMKDVPAFKIEPYSILPLDYLSTLNFELVDIKIFNNRPAFNLISNWGDLAFLYQKRQFFSSNLIGSGFLKQITTNLVKELQHPDEKVIKIYDFVRQKLDWNNRYSMYSYGLKTAFEAGRGTSGDINLILLSMLRYAGLPGDPILLSTRENGLVRQEMPNTYQFNNVVILTDLNGRKTILDATRRDLGHQFLPESCLSGVGYLSIPGNHRWINLANYDRTRKTLTGTFELVNGAWQGNLVIKENGYEAERARKLIKESIDLKEYGRKSYSTHSLSVLESTVEGMQMTDDVLTETHNVSFSIIDQSETALFYPAVIVPSISENPFRSDVRRTPIDFKYPREITSMIKYKIPDGFKVEFTPKDKMIILPDQSAKYTFSTFFNNEFLTVVSQFLFTRNLYSIDEYESIKEFFSVVIEKEREQIILTRKTEE